MGAPSDPRPLPQPRQLPPLMHADIDETLRNDILPMEKEFKAEKEALIQASDPLQLCQSISLVNLVSVHIGVVLVKIVHKINS